MLIHHGTRQRPKIAIAAMIDQERVCGPGRGSPGDCHSVMFAMPQSPGVDVAQRVERAVPGPPA